MYQPLHFELYELLPRGFYTKWYPKRENKLWQLFDSGILITIDKLRRRYGKIYINDWYWNGKDFSQWRGLRTFESPYGTELSQHRFCRAVDLIMWEVLAEKVRKDIIADPFCDDFLHIIGIEKDVSWLHIDTRNWNKTKYGLYLFGS